jgi:SAM-dependent methyltransferase
LTWEEAVIWLRAQPEHADLVRACFYDDPLLAAAERYHSSTEWSALRQLLRVTPGRVLDVGAGRGITSYAFAMDGWSTVALEPDGSAVVGAAAIRALAVEARLAIEVTQEWGERLPFPDASFDLVFGRAVMHHAHDLDAFCAQAARVLRPGGVFIGAREHVLSRTGDLEVFLDAHPLHALYGGEHAYELGQYRAALEVAGLDVVHVLNPFASDVNLFPASTAEVRAALARRWRLPSARLVPGFVLSWLAERSDVPGRLYTFVARKRHV